MKVRVEQLPDRWDSYLQGTRHDIFHTAGFQRFAAPMEQGDPYLIVVGDSERGLAWPYVLRRVSASCGLTDAEDRDVGSFHGYTGPVTWGLGRDVAFMTQALDLVQKTWREQGAITAFTRFHPVLGNVLGDVARKDGAPSVEPIGETISIDCTISDHEATDGYSRVLRQDIVRARDAGLRTRPDPEWDHVDSFVRLYSDSMTRKRAPSAYWVRAADVRRMREELGANLRLFVTQLRGKDVAVGIFSEHEGFVEAHMVGTDELYRQWSPLKVMLDDVRRWAHERGDQQLHLGGGRAGRKDSLFDFKRRFSPRRHTLHIGKWVLDQDRYQELDAVRGRRLEAAGLRSASTSWFPSYRSPVLPIEPAEVPSPDTQPVPAPVPLQALAIQVERDRIAIPVAREPIGRPVDRSRSGEPALR